MPVFLDFDMVFLDIGSLGKLVFTYVFIIMQYIVADLKTETAITTTIRSLPRILDLNQRSF